MLILTDSIVTFVIYIFSEIGQSRGRKDEDFKICEEAS